MTLHLDHSPRTAGTRRLLIGLAAVAGLVCGSGGVLAQGQRAKSAPAVPPSPPAAAIAPTAPAPPAPSPLAHRLVSINGPTANYHFMSDSNGHKVELVLENDAIVVAKSDGEDVPKDRIVREGNTVQFKDAQGNVTFEHTLPRSKDLRITVAGDPYTAISTSPRAVSGQLWRKSASSIPGPSEEVFIEAEEPKVMLGVTMMEPDPSLRGHLGLEPGSSTLVGVVYQGLPADVARLEPYDIIVAVNGNKPAGPDSIRKALREAKEGDEVKFTVIHRGKERDVTIKLEKFDRARFDESKAKKMAQVADESEAMKLRERYAQTLAGSVVGVPSDPNDPTAIFVPQGMTINDDMRQALLRAQAKMEEQIARSRQLQDQLNDKSAQTKNMEDRMRRMEELLQKLLDGETRKKESGGGADAAPVPEDLRPSKGLWAGRNPEA